MATMKFLIAFIGTVFLSTIILIGLYGFANNGSYMMETLYKLNMVPVENLVRKVDEGKNRTTKPWRPSLFPHSSQLGDFPTFQFTLNYDICQENRVDLLILVGSNPRNHKMRSVLRETWGFSPRPDNYVIKMAFLFGTAQDAKTQEKLVIESGTYSDVVQGNFRDSYHNVTLRDLMGFRWTWRQCWQARYVMRTDDDVSTDIARIIDVLENNVNFPKRDYLACYSFFVNAPVLRTGRYAISREEYPSDIYAPYCQGWTYWLSAGAAKKLDEAALVVKPFWMNDAYITGSLMKFLNWTHIILPIRYTNDPADLLRMLQRDATLNTQLLHGPNEGDVILAAKVQKRFQLNAKIHSYPRHTPPTYKPLHLEATPQS